MQEAPPPNIWGITNEITWVVLAMIGGISRYLDGYLKSGTAPKVGLLITHAMVSGFSGYMVAQVMLKFHPDWALIAAGIGGYLGTQGLDFLARVMKKKISGVDEPEKPATDEKPVGKDVTGA